MIELVLCFEWFGSDDHILSKYLLAHKFFSDILMSFLY